MAGTPLKITLYDPETEEVKVTYTRLFVPWRILKVAIRLIKELNVSSLNAEDLSKISEDDVDKIASLVVEAFGNKFTLEDLNNGSDLSDMMSVLQTIIAKASGSTNPTPPGR